MREDYQSPRTGFIFNPYEPKYLRFQQKRSTVMAEHCSAKICRIVVVELNCFCAWRFMSSNIRISLELNYQFFILCVDVFSHNWVSARNPSLFIPGYWLYFQGKLILLENNYYSPRTKSEKRPHPHSWAYWGGTIRIQNKHCKPAKANLPWLETQYIGESWDGGWYNCQIRILELSSNAHHKPSQDQHLNTIL